MIVVFYSKDGGLTTKIATSYIGLTLDQVKAKGWGNSPIVTRFYEVGDEYKQTLPNGTWVCALSAAQVQAQGIALP